MQQFVANAAALGHEVWCYPGQEFPEARMIPTRRIDHIRALRSMDALYVRLETRFPEIGAWSLPPRRWLYRFPVVAWEFNTVIHHAATRGQSEQDVQDDVRAFRRYGRGCDLAICVTPSLAEFARNDLAIGRTAVIHNGSDPDRFSPEAPSVDRMAPYRDKFNVVWVGSFKEKWHDTDLLAEAAQRIVESEDGQDIAIHLIGPDLTAGMAQMPRNVFYWGAERYDGMPGWLAAMDVGLNLYRAGPWDNAPLKVFDYMASRLTVVSTAQPFMQQLFAELAQPDLLVAPGDAPQLARVLLGLASDRERVRTQGEHGRKLVIDHYNWRRAAEDTMREIQAILDVKRGVDRQ